MKDYKPSEAFASLNDETLNTRAAELAVRLAALRAQIATLTEEVMQHVTDERAIQDVLDERLLAAQGDTPDWGRLLKEDGRGGMVMHRAAEKAITGLATRGYHPGLRPSGYFPDIQQRCLQVGLLRGAPELTLKVHDALVQLLPFIKPIDAERMFDEGLKSYKRLSVFESALSQHGSFFLALNEASGLYALCCTRYGRTRVEQRFTALMPLLEYVEKNHPYDDASPEQSSDDENPDA